MATGKFLLTALAVLAIIYVVPFLVYGLSSALWGLKPPAGVSPLQFLVSVLVTKVGTAIGFVAIFYLARSSLSGKWLAYATLWWVMFVLGEIGQTLGPNYTWKEAVAGVISETLYFPVSALFVDGSLGTARAATLR
jgi:hypothetical protein